MENNAVRSMIMYEDESVDIRYGNGARLQLSPCGCEFMLVKAADPSGHPLKPAERVRQRTRFPISAYKELLVAALAFRNKYARRPYLPQEVIPADHKKPFVSSNLAVQWPKLSSCEAEFGPGGETIVRSEDGQSLLRLAPSGEEFFVEFTCSLSKHTQYFSGGSEKNFGCQPVSHVVPQSSDNKTKRSHQDKERKINDSAGSRSYCPQVGGTALPKPGEVYQATIVINHHSCSSGDTAWCYPLSLARHIMSAHLSKHKDVGAEGSQTSDRFSAERRESLHPQALPLTCPSPHWHRWRINDPLTIEENSDQGLPTELVKVMWCQGVTYRILSGAISVVEVSPGDGSVIRSNGVLNTYFTHHKTEQSSGQVKEITYHLNNLPPDIPGQLYSTQSVVGRASRILSCYNDAKQSLKCPAMPSCLQDDQKGRCFPDPRGIEEQLKNVAETVEIRSNLVAAELEKIKRFNFLLENSHVVKKEFKSSCTEVEESPADKVNQEPVSEDDITEALQRTSKAIQDIDAVISAATLS